MPQDVELFQARCEPGTVLVNGLGATECGLVRQYVVDHETSLTGSTVPIGYPVEDMDVLLLDPDGQPVAAGEVGEIVVRSLYLAPGYWDRPDLTDVAFRRARAAGAFGSTARATWGGWPPTRASSTSDGATSR